MTMVTRTYVPTDAIAYHIHQLTKMLNNPDLLQDGEQRAEAIGQLKMCNLMLANDTVELGDAMESEHQQLVAKTMRFAKQEIHDVPTEPTEATRLLRARLNFSEVVKELMILGLGVDIKFGVPGVGIVSLRDTLANGALEYQICGPFNMKETIDGCIDASVVVSGCLSACGVPDMPFIRHVDANNLTKFPFGKAILREDGKYLKPEGFVPPDIDGVLKQVISALRAKRNLLEGRAEWDDGADDGYGGLGAPFLQDVPTPAHPMNTPSLNKRLEKEEPEIKTTEQVCRELFGDKIIEKLINKWRAAFHLRVQRLPTDNELNSFLCEWWDQMIGVPDPEAVVENQTGQNLLDSTTCQSPNKVTDLMDRFILTDSRTGAAAETGDYLVIRIDNGSDASHGHEARMAARRYRKGIQQLTGYAQQASRLEQKIIALDELEPPLRRSKDE